jgi:hypothetical protein
MQLTYRTLSAYHLGIAKGPDNCEILVIAAYMQ